MPDFDVAVVRRLAKPAVVLSKTTPGLDHGGDRVQLNGFCRNPWDDADARRLERGGAAVAVAAGMSPAAHGATAEARSNPASCCGLADQAARGRAHRRRGVTLTKGPLTGRCSTPLR